MTTKFGLDDIGCYADGAFGHRHIRETLADLVSDCDAEVAASLRSEMPDDAWDEDAALDLLNEHCDGVTFTFDSGDLLLVVSEEA